MGHRVHSRVLRHLRCHHLLGELLRFVERAIEWLLLDRILLRELLWLLKLQMTIALVHGRLPIPTMLTAGDYFIDANYMMSHWLVLLGFQGQDQLRRGALVARRIYLLFVVS